MIHHAVEHLSMCLLASWVSGNVRGLFKSLTPSIRVPEGDRWHPSWAIWGDAANVWTRSQASDSVVKTYTFMPKAVKGGITQSRNGMLWGGYSRPQEAPEGKKCACWGRGKQTLFPPTPPSCPFQLMLPSLEPDPCSYPSKQQGSRRPISVVIQAQGRTGEVGNRSGGAKWSLQSMYRLSTTSTGFVVVTSWCFTYRDVSQASAWPISVWESHCFISTHFILDVDFLFILSRICLFETPSPRSFLIPLWGQAFKIQKMLSCLLYFLDVSLSSSLSFSILAPISDWWSI